MFNTAVKTVLVLMGILFLWLRGNKQTNKEIESPVNAIRWVRELEILDWGGTQGEKAWADERMKSNSQFGYDSLTREMWFGRVCGRSLWLFLLEMMLFLSALKNKLEIRKLSENQAWWLVD